jgi:hypothetical protein
MCCGYTPYGRRQIPARLVSLPEQPDALEGSQPALGHDDMGMLGPIEETYSIGGLLCACSTGGFGVGSRVPRMKKKLSRDRIAACVVGLSPRSPYDSC